jgi:CheY-like chemotaxis protein
MPEETHKILLVEDNESDVVLFKTALERCPVPTQCEVLHESDQIAKLLYKAPPHENAFTPDLIVVDYKMPIDGGIALTEVKASPDFMHLPIIVLTGSPNPKDHRDAYLRHANICFRKPTNLTQYLDLVCFMMDLWFKRACRP